MYTTETVHSGAIPDRVKPKTIMVFTATFLFDVEQLNGLSETSTVCGRQVGRWQLDSKTKKFFRCVLAKATWQINIIAITKFSWPEDIPVA